MRNVATALVLLFMAGTLAPGVALARTSASPGPSLRVVTRTPLVVRGANFHPSERVTLRAPRAVGVVRTTAAGAFRAGLGALATDRCSFTLVAVGARGDRALVRVFGPRAMCAPAKGS